MPNVYGEYEFSHKGFTREEDIGKGQVNVGNLKAPLFLQLQLVKTHAHKGTDSVTLDADATPEMVRAFTPREREEHGSITWSGTAAASGGVTLTFQRAFSNANYTVLLTARSNGNNANIQVAYRNKTVSSVDIYWKDDTGSTHTSVVIDYLIKGK